jgi:hypothetical protein
VDRKIARIETFPSDDHSCLVTIDPSIHDPLRTIALITPFLIANWREPNAGGGN